jgi:hypothetical protein
MADQTPRRRKFRIADLIVDDDYEPPTPAHLRCPGCDQHKAGPHRFSCTWQRRQPHRRPAPDLDMPGKDGGHG